MKDIIINNFNELIFNMNFIIIKSVNITNDKIVISGNDFILNIYVKKNNKYSFLKQGKNPDAANEIVNYFIN